MSGSINYRHLREQISMSDVLRLIQYPTLRGREPNYYGPCPLRCCPGRRCGHFSAVKKCWYCRACKRGGNHLDLYAALLRLPLYVAALKLASRLGVSVRPAPAPAEQRRDCP